MSIVNGGYVTRQTKLAIVDIRVTVDGVIDGYTMTKGASRPVGALVTSRDDTFRQVRIDKRFERIAGIRIVERDLPQFRELAEQYGAI